MPLKRMNLHAKRFRSKAPSATCLSPGQFGCCEMKSLDFLCYFYYGTVSKRGGRECIQDLIDGAAKAGLVRVVFLPRLRREPFGRLKALSSSRGSVERSAERLESLGDRDIFCC